MLIAQRKRKQIWTDIQTEEIITLSIIRRNNKRLINVDCYGYSEIYEMYTHWSDYNNAQLWAKGLITDSDLAKLLDFSDEERAALVALEPLEQKC